jgi:hypothetical protein
MAGAGQKPGIGPVDPRHVSVRQRHAVLHGGELEEACVDSALRGEPALQALDLAGRAARRHVAQFRDALTRENHTLKRSLTDPHPSAASATPLRRSARGWLAGEADATLSDEESVAVRRGAAALRRGSITARRGEGRFPRR